MGLALLAGVLAACHFGRMVVIGLKFSVTWICVLMSGLHALTALQVGRPGVG